MDENEQVAIVFETIGNAAQMLRAVRPGLCADLFEKQMDRAFYADPTLAQQVLARSKDIERKLKMLRAAEAFATIIFAVGEEIIAESQEQK